jgi:hypothetical protein
MTQKKIDLGVSVIQKLSEMLKVTEKMQIDFLKELDASPAVQQIDKRIGSRLFETSETNQAYVQMMKKSPNEIHTVYAAVDVLSKNDEIQNDKFEMLGIMMSELNKHLMTLSKLQHETSQILIKLLEKGRK